MGLLDHSPQLETGASLCLYSSSGLSVHWAVQNISRTTFCWKLNSQQSEIHHKKCLLPRENAKAFPENRMPPESKHFWFLAKSHSHGLLQYAQLEEEIGVPLQKVSNQKALIKTHSCSCTYHKVPPHYSEPSFVRGSLSSKKAVGLHRKETVRVRGILIVVDSAEKEAALSLRGCRWMPWL